MGIFTIVLIIAVVIVGGVAGLYKFKPDMYNSMIQSNLSFLPMAPMSLLQANGGVSPTIPIDTSLPAPPPIPATTVVSPAVASVTPTAAIAPITAVTPIAEVTPTTLSGTVIKQSSAGPVAVPTITPADAVTKYSNPAAGIVVGCIQSSWQNSTNTYSTSATGPMSCIIKSSLGPCSQQGLSGPPQCTSCGVNVTGCNKMAALYSQMYSGGDLAGTYTY